MRIRMTNSSWTVHGPRLCSCRPLSLVPSQDPVLEGIPSPDERRDGDGRDVTWRERNPLAASASIPQHHHQRLLLFHVQQRPLCFFLQTSLASPSSSRHTHCVCVHPPLLSSAFSSLSSSSINVVGRHELPLLPAVMVASASAARHRRLQLRQRCIGISIAAGDQG